MRLYAILVILFMHHRDDAIYIEQIFSICFWRSSIFLRSFVNWTTYARKLSFSGYVPPRSGDYVRQSCKWISSSVIPFVLSILLKKFFLLILLIFVWCFIISFMNSLKCIPVILVFCVFSVVFTISLFRFFVFSGGFSRLVFFAYPCRKTFVECIKIKNLFGKLISVAFICPKLYILPWSFNHDVLYMK